MTLLIQAFRSALRSFRRRPGFFAVATVALSVALGLSTSVFAMIDALRHPLVANREIDQLYHLGGRGRFAGTSRPELADVHERARLMPGIEAATSYLYRAETVMAGDRTANRAIHRIADDYFGVMGIAPARGRQFAADDYQLGSTAIVSDKLWRAHFANRADLAGATVSTGERTYDIVGVLPPHALAADILIPSARQAIASVIPGNNFAVRLKPGRTPESMATELNSVAEHFIAQFGRGNPPYAYTLRSAKPDPLGLSAVHFWMIGAAIGIVIIACANVTALMLARGVVTRRDRALQLALGASSAHLSLRVFAEVAVLAGAGAVGGVLLAVWTTKLFVISVPEGLNFAGLPTPQWSVRVFAMLFATTIVVVGLAAAAPAWFASRTQPNEPLKDNSGTTTSRAGSRFRFLVVAEIAMSMILVFGASLMAKTVRQYADRDFGFDAEGLVQAWAWLPFSRDTAGRTALVDQHAAALLARVRAMPGVEAATQVSSDHPEGGAIVSDRTAEGGPTLFMGDRGYSVIGTDYFRTFGIPMVEGREFLEGDRERGAVVLSEAAALALFPRESAVGRFVKLGDRESGRAWVQVVGVARNLVRSFDDEAVGLDPRIVVYAFTGTTAGGTISVIVRARSNPAAVTVDLRRALTDFSPPGSIVNATLWLDRYRAQLRVGRYVVRLFALLGTASLALAVAGLFSVLSYIVSQRMREFAVRMALGARRPDVLRLVAREAGVMALAGTGIGAIVGMRVGFVLWDLIGNVYPVDVEALLIAEVALLLASLAAAVLPALRATRANPVDVMRAT